jgi:phospholipid:diacylglycerol acyltransferase
MVGVPKALTAMLSGETRDTMNLGSFSAYLLEKFFSRRERANLMRTWAGGASMIPKGSDIIWGTHDQAPDDEEDSKHHSYGNLISFTKANEQEDTEDKNHTTEKMINKDVEVNYSIEESLELLHQTAAGDFSHMLETNYSYGITTSRKQLEKNNLDPKKWSNPLESQLPIGELCI